MNTARKGDIYWMKTVSIVVPTYNEEENIPIIYQRIKNLFDKTLVAYNYKILFIDNCSTDASRKIIKDLAQKDSNVQYIFNIKNFGFSRSTFYGLTQSQGDCSVLLSADLQEPPELIIDFIAEWEKGYKMVGGIKNCSQENQCMYFIRKCYYKFMNYMTDIPHIEQFTGFGLYDKSVINVFAEIKDSLPYLRGIVAELAPECKQIAYEQKKRIHGKTAFNLLGLYDLAMLGLTSYSKALMRISMFSGVAIACVSFIVALITVFLKLTGRVQFPVGAAATVCGVFFLGGIQLIFLGVLGEYISNINIRCMNRPMVVEEERNF